MAFNTIPGAAGTDAATSYIGTAGVDALVLINQTTGTADVRGQAAGDAITWNSYTNVTVGTSMRGGKGTDTFNPVAAASGNLSGAFINGQKDRDVFGGVIGLATTANSTLMGGQGADAITFASGTVTGSIVNGNKNADVITTVGTQSSSIYGGQGIDQLVVSGANSGSIIRGNLDGDTIQLAGTFAGTTVNGNAGNDTINDGAAAITAFATSAVNGGGGIDTINLSNNTGAIGLVVSGDNGNDNVTTSTGTDTVNGGAGADTLTAGAGADAIDGGTGADTFTQTNGAVAAATGGTALAANLVTEGETVLVAADVITNFEAGTDTIDTTVGTAAVQAGVGINAGSGLGIIDTTDNGGHFVARGNYVAGTFTFSATGSDLASFTATNGAGAAVAVGTAFTVLKDQGANVANVIAGNWA